MEILFIGLFGALGAISRHGLNVMVTRWCGESFPWGILLINVAGCFLLGLLAQLSQTSELLSSQVRNALGVGFLGAFTTFSTFGFDTFRQLESGRWDAAALNIAGNVVVGLVAVWLGVGLARFFSGGS